MNNILVSPKWQAVKEAMKEGLKENMKGKMEVLLDNVLKESSRHRRNAAFLTENASANATSAGNIAAINQVVLPLIRRVLPGVIANELVGVQALSGPFGQVSTLRTVYKQGISGVSAGYEAMAPRHVNDLAKAYSGNQDNSAPGAAQTMHLEGVPGNAIGIEILKQQVEVGTRRMSARWTIESAQDAQAQYGVDMEAENLSAIAQHMTLEIDQELLLRLRSLPPAATAANTFDQSRISGQATFVGDEFAVLAILIAKEVNDIMTRTRRYVPNGFWTVVSPTALTVLQAAKSSAFARTTEGDFEGPVNMKMVGTLNNSVKVFCDVFASESTSCLVGFKGSDTDAGLFFCPYIPLMQSDTVQDPNTLEFTVGFMSRYAIVTLQDRATSLGNSADYYGLVGMNSTNLSFL